MTPMRWSIERAQAAPEGVTRLSPRACQLADAFRKAPTQLGPAMSPRKGRRGRSSVNATTGARSSPSTCSPRVGPPRRPSTRQRPIAWPCRLTPKWRNVSARAERSPRLAREYWSHYYPSQAARAGVPAAATGARSTPSPTCRAGRPGRLSAQLHAAHRCVRRQASPKVAAQDGGPQSAVAADPATLTRSGEREPRVVIRYRVGPSSDIFEGPGRLRITHVVVPLAAAAAGAAVAAPLEDRRELDRCTSALYAGTNARTS